MWEGKKNQKWNKAKIRHALAWMCVNKREELWRYKTKVHTYSVHYTRCEQRR